MQNVSTRSRLALLVIVSALPALGLSIYNGLERRAQAEISAREDLKKSAALAAKHQEETVEGARQLLFALAGTAESLRKDPKKCQEFFTKLAESSGGLYRSIGIHGADGYLICGTVSSNGRPGAKDRRYFRLTADAGKFAVGDYEIDRVTGLRGIRFGYPVMNAERNAIGVVFAELDLDKLSEITARTPLPLDGRLTVFDRSGVILALHPHVAGRIGETVRIPKVIEAIQASGEQLFDADDTDGVRRLFAVQGVGINPDGGVPLHVLVSTPRQIILADADLALLQTTIGIVTATLLLALGAWYGAEIAVLRRVRALLGVTSRIRAGDLTARTGFPPSEEELSQLGNALDEMAQALQKRDADLKRALRELSEQVITDPLTGLNNRRYLWDFLGRDLLRARRAVLPVAAILFDIDHFKRFNDTWGHEAGDLVLKSAGEVIRQNVRGSDIACRYGGEEFIVILPEATRTVAIDRAERIRRGIEQMALTVSGQPLDRVTASFGIALYPTHADDAEALVRVADEALYLAKKGGRNRVQVYIAKPSLF